MDTEITIKQASDFVYIFTLLAITVAMVLETLVPRRKLESGLAWRWINNFLLGTVTWFLTSVAVTLFLFSLARWTELNHFGLFQQFKTPAAVSFAVLIVVTQFLSYALHVAFHKVSWLWPIHAIHHTDTFVDVSTSYRNHPLEIIIGLPVVAPVVLMLGVPANVALTYQLLGITINIFSHSNIRVPAWIERYLRFLVVTPDFHRLHHCKDREFTDSNYGSTVPWFDYLFRTATSKPFDEQEKIGLGLEYLREPRESRVDRLLLLPFSWRKRMADEIRENPRASR